MKYDILCETGKAAVNCKLSNPSMPLDVDPVAQIEVYMVCTKEVVCT